jgi:lipopolysaccharide transport system permease protein
MSSAVLTEPSDPTDETPAVAPEPPARRITRIGGRRRPLVDLPELWQFRELLVRLVWRDVSVRFKQTILGIGWAVAQPLATMLVFAVFLGRMGRLGDGVAAYPLFVMAGVLPWAFFSSGVANAGNSVVGSAGLLTKVYFPRLILPLAAFGTPLVDLAIASTLLAGLMAWYGMAPGASVLALPLVIGLLTLAAAGIGVLLSALIVAQRDFRYLLNFGMQLWMFATPCIYLPPESIGPTAQRWLPLNPAYGPILNFRQAVLGGPIDWYSLGVSAAVSGAILWVGLWYFRRVEKAFADVI